MTNKVMWIVTWVVIIGVISFLFIQQGNKPKTGFILISDVYGSFDLKKQLEQKFTITKNARQKIVDSLAFELKLLAKKIDAEKSEKSKSKTEEELYNTKRQEFYQRTQSFNEDNKELTKQYDQEILSQLNQYVKDYGKENNYQYIFGNDGNGSLMHAQEANNITKEIIEYINDKYKGKK